MFVKSLTRGRPKSDTNTNTGLYITDEQFPKHYKQHVVHENPAVTVNKNYLTGYTKDHFQPNVNALKTVEISIVSSGPTAEKYTDFGDNVSYWSSWDFGNWRTCTSLHINENVTLRLDSNTLEMGYEYTFENLWEKVMGNKLVSTVDQAASNARMFADAVSSGGGPQTQAGLMISKYKNIPVLKDVSTFSLPSSLKFEFSFGSAGIFSGEEEVVKPILAIARALAPTFSGNFVTGNAPSTERALAEIVQGIWGRLTGGNRRVEKTDGNNQIKLNGKGVGLNDSDLQDEELVNSMGGNFVDTSNNEKKQTTSLFETVSTDVANKLTNLQNIIHEAFDGAAKDLLTQKENFKGIRLRMGRLVLPPMIVKKVIFNFDFDKIDEYGFPYKGTLTLDGLETVATATAESVGIL